MRPRQTCLTAAALPWHHCHMSSSRLRYKFREVCSIISNQRVALPGPCSNGGSVWRVLLVWLRCHARFHHDHHGYLYPAGPSSQPRSVLLWAPTAGNNRESLAPFSNWPPGLPVSLKNAAHQSAEEQIMRWDQRGIQGPLSRVNMDSSPRSLQHCSFLLQPVYQSVSPHIHTGLFLAGENCAVVCLCAGVGLWRRALEKYGVWWTSQNISQCTIRASLSASRWSSDFWFPKKLNAKSTETSG